MSAYPASSLQVAIAIYPPYPPCSADCTRSMLATSSSPSATGHMMHTYPAAAFPLYYSLSGSYLPTQPTKHCRLH